jgi:hypothetical protein
MSFIQSIVVVLIDLFVAAVKQAWIRMSEINT